MKKHSTARRVLALGLNLTLAGVPAWLWADEEPTELPALTVSAGAAGETPPALDLDDSAGGGSRLGLSLRETPGSVSVANRASFERRGLRSTQDIANSLPGVNASAPPGFGGFVTYRGFQLEPGQPVVQRHSGAIQQRHASAGRLDRRPRRAGRRSVLLPQRRRCRRRLAGLHQQARRPLRRFHGRPGALWQLRRFGSRLRLQPGPGHRPRAEALRAPGRQPQRRQRLRRPQFARIVERRFLPAQRPDPGPFPHPGPGVPGRAGRQPLLGHTGAQSLRRRAEDRQEPSPRELQRRRWPLRTARALAALDPRIPGQRQHALAQHLLPLRRRARLPQPRDLPLQRRQQRGGALQRIPPAPRPAAQRQPLRATAQPAAVRTGQRLGAGFRLQHQQADALPEYRLRAVRYGRSGQFRAGPLLRPARHASRPPEGPQQRGAHQRVVRREPPGPDRRAVAGHRAALRPPRPRRAQPSDGDRQRSCTLRTALGRAHRARRAGLPVHPARQRLPAIQYRRRPAGRC